jgi:hypothetical protein
MRRWGLPCGLVAGLLVFGAVVLCVIVLIGGFIGLGNLAKSLPTLPVPPKLVIGKTYWIGALVPPAGLPAGLVIPNVQLFNKPGSTISDPSVTIVAILDDATPVKLTGIRDEWCYIKATDQFGKQVEGWLDCDRLLGYKPTPIPTPNLTPEKP